MFPDIYLLIFYENISVKCLEYKEMWYHWRKCNNLDVMFLDQRKNKCQ